MHCENPAPSSNCPLQIEFNLNPVKRTFDEELWRGYPRRWRMDKVALFVTPPAVAETVTEVLDEPGDVLTMNVAEPASVTPQPALTFGPWVHFAASFRPKSH